MPEVRTLRARGKILFDQATRVGKKYLNTNFHKGGMQGVKETLGLGPGVGSFKWLSRGMLGFAAIQGFREDGVYGAATGVGSWLAWDYAVGAVGVKGWALAAFGAKVAAGAATVATVAPLAAGLNPLTFWARPAIRQRTIKNARLELGSPVVDSYGTVATMRQRSLQSIQNSKLNGRGALGSEAALAFRPYFS